MSFSVYFWLRYPNIFRFVSRPQEANLMASCFYRTTMILNYKADHIKEVLVHQYYDQSILSVKNEKNVLFIFRENLPQEKIQKYVMDPYLTSRRTRNYTVQIISKEVESVKVKGKVYTLK